MALFAIGDTHLSLSANKPMDVFGGGWTGYVDKLSAGFRALVAPEDTVVIAGDVLDSGLTLTYLLKTLKARNPKSIEVATLLRKKTRAQAKIDCAYVGFECPDEFIVGYGLDYAERYRNLPYIGVLKPELYN